MTTVLLLFHSTIDKTQTSVFILIVSNFKLRHDFKSLISATNFTIYYLGFSENEIEKEIRWITEQVGSVIYFVLYEASPLIRFFHVC